MTQEIDLGGDSPDWEPCRFCGGEIVLHRRTGRCEDCNQVYLVPDSWVPDE